MSSFWPSRRPFWRNLKTWWKINRKMIDFWVAETMKIVFLLKRAYDFKIFSLPEKDWKIDTKKAPKINHFWYKIDPLATSEPNFSIFGWFWRVPKNHHFLMWPWIVPKSTWSDRGSPNGRQSCSGSSSHWPLWGSWGPRAASRAMGNLPI